MTIYVIDTSTFLEAPIEIILNHEGVLLTVPETLEEIERYPELKGRILPLIQDVVECRIPNNKYISIVEDHALRTGDLPRLSPVDKRVLALALGIADEHDIDEVVLITEDYTIQNMCKRMGIKFKALVHGTIDRYYEWICICIGCRREYSPSDAKSTGYECPYCGKKLKTKRIV